MATLLILNGKITTPGAIAYSQKVYEPILKELEDYGVILEIAVFRIQSR
jgi:hypothetical protein